MVFALVLAASLSAQSLDDAQLVARRTLGVGVSYTHENWSQYWEGTLKRSNGNVGTVSTQTMTLLSAYGVTDRLTVLAMLPYIWTDASQGTLHSMHGIQDLTIGAKYRLLATPFTELGTLRAIVVAAAGTPASEYTPDFLPLAIGLDSKRVASRVTLNFQAHLGWFLTGSAGYTWRGNVTLNRPSYYTNGQLYLTNEVDMPNVADYVFTAGYQKGGLCVPVSFAWQNTLGGGDIRRQDMPFVSNNMDFTRVEGMVMYTLPSPRDLSVRFGASHVVDGRNVGQSTAFSGTLFYGIHF